MSRKEHCNINPHCPDWKRISYSPRDSRIEYGCVRPLHVDCESIEKKKKERTALQDRDRLMREEGAKAERERVLKIVDQIREAALGMLNPPTGSFSSQDRFRKECMDEIDLLIKSLRSPGQKRERDPE